MFISAVKFCLGLRLGSSSLKSYSTTVEHLLLYKKSIVSLLILLKLFCKIYIYHIISFYFIIIVFVI